MNLNGTETVAEIAREYPDAIPVFEAYGIDYCCGGKKPLEAVCATRNLSLNCVVARLSAAVEAPNAPHERTWADRPLGDLAHYIVHRHHDYAKRELPRLAALAAKVEARHGAAHPELGELRQLVDTLRAELEEHMAKEEHVLFPRMRIIDEAAAHGAKPLEAFFEELVAPIRHMMADHDDAGDALRALRTLTKDYTLPGGACLSYQALYHGLQSLERDLHQHIHLENNVLFPRLLEPELAL